MKEGDGDEDSHSCLVQSLLFPYRAFTTYTRAVSHSRHSSFQGSKARAFCFPNNKREEGIRTDREQEPGLC